MLEKTFLFISLAFALFMGTALGTTVLGVTQTVTVSMLPFCIYIAIESFNKKINWNERDYLLEYALIIVAILGIIEKIALDQDYFKEYLCLIILPTLIFIALLHIDEKERKILKWMVIAFFITECTIAIIEHNLQINFFVNEEDITTMYSEDWNFRSTGILGHPLMNAMVVAVMLIFIVTTNTLNIYIKFLLFVLGFFAILAFNARGATIVSVCITLPILIRDFLRNKNRKKNIILLIPIGLIMVSYLRHNVESWGGRLFNDTLLDGSANTRIEVFNFYKYISIDDILYGSPDIYIYLMRKLGAGGVENGEISLIISYGLVLFACFFPMLITFHWKWLRRYFSLYDTVCIMAVFYLIGSMNPNLSLAFCWTYWIFAFHAFMPIVSYEESEYDFSGERTRERT